MAQLISTKILSPFVVFWLIYNEIEFSLVKVCCFKNFHIFFVNYHIYGKELLKLGMAVNKVLIYE